MQILRGSPEDFGKMISDETDKWGKAIKSPTSADIERPLVETALRGAYRLPNVALLLRSKDCPTGLLLVGAG